MNDLAASLPSSWSVAQVVLSSSYSGWGTSSLVKDAYELGKCVSYFRTIKPTSGKIVLMGHSTGCQDVMEYLVGEGSKDRPKIDGGILQASVSDREAMLKLMSTETYEYSVRIAREMIDEGRGEDILPKATNGGFFGDPCSARRWLSLASPDGNGDDDYFSSDLCEEQLRRSFGSIGNSAVLSIIYSGNDEYVPDSVDKVALVKKWLGFVRDGGGDVMEEFSTVVAGASHNFMGNPKHVIDEMVQKVVGFVKWVEHREYSKL